MGHETLFLANLPLIERIARSVARSLSPEDKEDFASQVKLRFIENDYAVLARFEGRSRLSTYLTTVIQRIYVDDQVRAQGRWRPSAAARHRGALAVRLERLLHRDGLSIDEAVEVLKGDPGVKQPRGELLELAFQLPPRRPLRPIARDPPDEDAVAVDGHVEDVVLREELRAVAARVGEVLRRVLGELTPRERIIIKMLFCDSASAAEIARFYALETRKLYPLKEQLLRQLKARLTAEGVSREDILALLDQPDLLDADDFSLLAALAAWEKPDSGPSDS